MSSKNIRLGVVGVGHLGKHHARLLAGMANATLVGVVDTDPVNGKIVADSHGVPLHADFRALDGQVDAVTIAVPTSLHHQVARHFMQQGVHVLVEKPITATLDEATELLRLSHEKKLTLQVGHVERFNAATIKLQELTDNPRFIECQRMGPFSKRISDVGVVLDLMIHDIDIVLSLVKSKIARVDAVGIPVLSRHEDIANAHILFENGCIANLTASRVSEERIRKLRVFEFDKYLSLDFANQAITLRRTDTLEERIIKEELEVHKVEPLKLELEHFVDCVRSGKKPLVTVEDGKNALEVAMEILQISKSSWPRH